MRRILVLFIGLLVLAVPGLAQEDPIFGTAIVTYEHPDGKYYPFPYNPLAGPGVETVVVSQNPLPPPPDDLPPNPLNPDDPHTKLKLQLNYILRQAAQIAELAHVNPTELVHISEIIDGLGESDNTIPGGSNTIRPRDFSSITAFLLAKLELLDADRTLIDGITDWSRFPDLRGLWVGAGDMLRNVRSMLGEILSNNDLLPMITEQLEVLNTAALIANIDLELTPGATVGDVIELRRQQLLNDAAMISDLWHSLMELAPQKPSEQNAETNNNPCWPVFWYSVLGGWELVDRIGYLAQNAALYVHEDSFFTGTLAGVANDRLGDIHGWSKETVNNMFGIGNGILREVNTSGRECIEGWVDFPDMQPNMFYFTNPANRA